MTIRMRLYILAFLPVVLAVVAALAVFWANGEAARGRVAEQASTEITKNLFELTISLQEYLRQPEERPRVQCHSLLNRLRLQLAHYPAVTSEQRVLLDALRQSHEVEVELFSLLEAIQQQIKSHPQNSVLHDRQDRLVGQLLVKSRDLTSDALRLSRESTSHMELVQGGAQHSILFLIILVSSIMLLVACRTVQSISGPIGALTRWAKAIATGDLGYRAETEKQDELGQLARTFAEMASALAEARQMERVKTESLRNSEQRFRALVTASSDVLYRMSADWSEMIQLLGNSFLADTETMDRDWLKKYIHLDDQPAVLAAIGEAIASTTVFEFEHRVLRQDGSLGWTFSRAVPLIGPDGEVVEWFGAASDITARRNAEMSLRALKDELELKVAERTAELRRKDEMLLLQSRQAAMGELIGNIAHQWRQPLNVLGMNIQQLSLFYDLGEFNGDLLHASTEEAMKLIKYMSQTIDDFSHFTRPENVAAPFGIEETIAMTIALVAGSFKNHNIQIEAEVRGDLTVVGYRNQYVQALLNILNNARDVLLERRCSDPRVTVGASCEGGRSIVTVTDNAGGIPEEIMGKIFDPYFSTKGVQGTGVGLFMSKTIIEKNMGGRISAHNTPNGAEFRIEV